MAVVNPIPGQETRNTQLLTEHRLARKVGSAAEVVSAIEEDLDRKPGWFEALETGSDRGRFSKPEASRDIAALTLSLC